MEHALGVGRGEAVRGLDGIPHRGGHGEATARNPLPQRLPLEQLGDQVGGAVRAPDVEDGEDVGVGNGGGGPGLDLEPPHPLGVLREVRRQHLDRDLAPELGIEGPVNLTHPACAQQGQ